MYTWGYIKEASLAKLDLDEPEANEQNLLSRFHIYANEAMTQICSAVKPNHTYATFVIEDKASVWMQLRIKYNVYSEYLRPIVKPSTLSNDERLFWNDFESRKFVGELQTMPTDFIAFDNDVNTREWQDFMCNTIMSECHDDELIYKGNNKLIFLKSGKYTISYKARWITFYPNMSDDELLDIPMDILDCLPSYIASQCYKIDDEVKSSIFRNEYEMFLARIDDTHFTQNKTFEIGGDW